MYLCRSLESSLNDRFVFIIVFGRWISIFLHFLVSIRVWLKVQTSGWLEDSKSWPRFVGECANLVYFFCLSVSWMLVINTSARCPCRLLPQRQGLLGLTMGQAGFLDTLVLMTWNLWLLWRCVADRKWSFSVANSVWPKSYLVNSKVSAFLSGLRGLRKNYFEVLYIWVVLRMLDLLQMFASYIYSHGSMVYRFQQTARSGPNTNYQLISHDAPGGWKATTWWNLFCAESPGPNGADLIQCQEKKATFQMWDCLF